MYVDKGYQGHHYPKLRLYKSGQKRGITHAIKRGLKRRHVVETVIEHVKQGHGLDRNYLLGMLSDKMNALLVRITNVFVLTQTLSGNFFIFQAILRMNNFFSKKTTAANRRVFFSRKTF